MAPIRDGRFVVPAAIVAIALVLTPRAAQAQGASTVEWTPPPSRGLFGGDARTTGGQGHLFDMTWSLFGGYDDDDTTTFNEPEFGDPGLVIGGGYSALGGILNYGWRNRTYSVGATAATRVRYYPDGNNFLVTGHSAGLGFGATFDRRTTVRAEQSVVYSPLFSVNTFPVLSDPGLGVTVPPEGDMSVASLDGYQWATTADMSTEISDRSAFTARYAFQRSRYAEDLQDLSTQLVSGELARRMARRTSMNLGYTFQAGTYELDQQLHPVYTQDVLVRVEHTWVHSATRTTVLSVGAGPTFINADTRQLVRPSVNVDFAVPFSRDWSMRASYSRGVEFVPGLRDAAYLDAAALSVTGLMTSRLQFDGYAGYSLGPVGFEPESVRYAVYSGVGRVAVAVSRGVALFAEAFVYHADAPASQGVTDPSSSPLDRRGFRVGTTLWIPVLMPRQPRDTR